MIGKRLIRLFCLLTIAIGTFICAQSSISWAASAISWEIQNRFRIIDGYYDEDAFVRQLRRFIRDAEGRSRYPSFGEQMPRSKWSSKDTSYQSGYSHIPESWLIKISLSGKLSERSRFCEWRLDGDLLSNSSCETWTSSFTSKPTTVAVIVRDKSNNIIANDSIIIQPSDLLVVSLGDSFASGEGAPEVSVGYEPNLDIMSAPSYRPARWTDHLCHRSLLSGHSLTALALARQNKHQSVTFLSFACSGAEIAGQGKGVNGDLDPTDPGDGGLLSPYIGRETPRQVRVSFESANATEEAPLLPETAHLLSAQIEAAHNALCMQQTADTRSCSGEHRQPDIVLLSIGGNDVLFGPVIKDLIVRRCDAGSSCIKDVQNNLKKRFSLLPLHYEQLKNHLQKLNARRVLITTYPDPTQDENGQLCDDKKTGLGRTAVGLSIPFLPYLVGLDKAEYLFARDSLLKPLNQAIRDIKDDKWSVVDVSKTFHGKGICSSRSWFNTVWGSYKRQGLTGNVEDTIDGRVSKGSVPAGAAHPNIFGYCGYARELTRAIQGKSVFVPGCDGI
ncbi:MAG: hypothetical protein HZB31_00025 [Nitrospirae bacterium]|nr:hypothetical protein [Nitrospirota bacterium]